ncbi:MAG: glycosyltransferase [Fibrobacter sp.]|nr:glycosyltransferase [Fibrobacter sp.]
MKTCKSICFCGHFTGGGVEKATFLVANSLCESFNVFIINTCERDPVFSLNKKIIFAKLIKKSLLRKNIHFFKFLKKNHIDVVISAEAMTGFVSILPAKLAHCKHIIWEHANYFQNQGVSYVQKVRQFELKHCDAYVVLTKRDKRNFENHFKIKTKLEQIYNIAESQSQHKYDITSKTIISAGHIRKIKNFIVIPEIAKIVFAKHPDWKWEIYGTPAGDEYERIKSKVDEYNLQNNVIFCGRSNNMTEVYKKSAMYVMTSLQEGFPMVLLEAKSNKLPLISFNIETGPDEIIQDGTNGFLVKPYDIEEMAERICNLIEQFDKRIYFSAQTSLNQECVKKEVILQLWINLLNTI